MRIIIGYLTAGAILAGLALAQEGPKQEVKDAGGNMKEAGKATGRAAKHTGRAVKKGTKKAVHKSAEKTEEGAAKVSDKTNP